MRNAHRDLSSAELWDRSLARSRQRRALAPKVRREHRRRKRLSAAVAAATMAGPGTPMAMAGVSGDIQADVAAATPSKRAIEVREGGLPLMLGSQGPLVAEVQRALALPADGIFGAQTDTAVRQYQSGAGLRVDGIVGPATWSSLVEKAVGGSNVPQPVKDRLEHELRDAGQELDAAEQDPSDGLFGGPDDASSGEESSPTGETGSTGDTGQTDAAPPTEQPDTPATGGGDQTSTPVSGSCGSSTIAAPVKGTVTSEFGPRWGRNHDGIDIAAPTGTAIRAAACGTVTVAGQQSGYGNIVCITHTSQFSTCYAHLSGFATSQGAQVKQGQVIGYAGCTGHCTGPHLHFETRVNGQATNPRAYLNGTTIPGQTASTAKATSSTGKAGSGSNAAGTATTSTAGGATAQAAWRQSQAATATSESVAAREQVTAETAVGPTTETAAPSTPEAMIGEAPTEAAPAPVAPAPAAPAPVEAPVAAAPVEAAPVEAAPAPAPVESAPIEAAPVESAPVESAPVEAAPVESAPVESAPVESAPVESAPVESAPVEAAPAPVEAAPVEAAPVEAAPVEAAPVEAAPVEAAPVEAAPAPEPVEGLSVSAR